MKHGTCLAIGLILLTAAPLSLAANGQQQVGDYTIYYNALSADALPAATMRTHGLTHSATQGLVVISVSRGNGANAVEVAAQVSGRAKTLLGKPLPLHFRNIDDNGSLSTLGSFTVPGTDTVRFELDVTPQGGPTTHLQFTHDYVID